MRAHTTMNTISRIPGASISSSIAAQVLCAFSLLGGTLLAQNGEAAQAPVLIRAERILVDPDTTFAPGELLVRDGRIAAIGESLSPEQTRGASLVVTPGTLAPGLVTAHSNLGQRRDLSADQTAAYPALKAVDAFDPFLKELAEAGRSGVTCVALAPGSEASIGGRAALVVPGMLGTVGSPDALPMGRAIDPDNYLKVSLAGEARSNQRFPTSLMGGVDLVQTMFAAAAQAQGDDPEIQALLQVVAGSRRMLVHARTRAELRAGLQLAEQHGIAPMLLGADQAEDLLPRIARAQGSLLLPPLNPTATPRVLELAKKAHAAGVRVAFIGDTGPELRWSAAIAVRHGLDPKVAWAAITATPADLLGASAQVGTLRTGCRADITVWTGHPLDLASRLTGVWSGGVALTEPAKD